MRPVGRLAHAFLLILVGCAAGLAQDPGTVAPSGGSQAAAKPPWERYLTGDHAARARRLEQQVERLAREGRFGDAIGPAGELADLRARLQGADHWQAANARRAADALRTTAALPEEGRKAMATVGELMDKLIATNQRGQYAESERLARLVLQIRRRWLGEGHPVTAASYNNLARTLNSQGKYAEAEALHRKALAVELKALDEGHPDTATVYHNLAITLNSQGKYAEAEALHRKALAIRLKALGEGHPLTADSYTGLAMTLNSQGKYAEAEALHRKALAVRLKALGEGHPLTADSYNSLAYTLRAQGKYAEAEAPLRKALAIRLKALGEAHPDTAHSFNNLALILEAQGKSAEAEALHRKALAVRLKALGEGHPVIADSYFNLAITLESQGKYAEAEALDRKALAIRLKVRGEGHPDTATVYHNLAITLESQGKYAEAEAFDRKALAIRLKALGEAHPETARVYNNLAYILNSQGKYAEAEALLRKALAIRLKAQGEAHPDTARVYHNLAGTLERQGKSAEAEALLRKALAIRLKALGEGHPLTARTYSDLAIPLQIQGKYAEAEALHRKALAVELKALGEGHPDTAGTYSGLANTLDDQGKSAEAEALHRKALAIRLKVLGEGHPDTATVYHNLASTLGRQGKYAEAEALLRKALAIRLKALGEAHHITALTHRNLATTLDHQGKSAEAMEEWMAAAAAYERSGGARGATGLERSLALDHSPLPGLAIALARQGRPDQAWSRWEADLARGLLDDLSARSLRPLNPDERLRQAELAGKLQSLDERIGRLAGRPGRTPDEEAQLDGLKSEQNDLRGRWVEIQVALERKYRASAGQPSPLEDIQKTIPGDTALVGWLEMNTRHWACLVRHDGPPVWVQTPGSGPDGRCTEEDHQRAQDCQAALAANRPDWRGLAAAVGRERLGPLVPHLRGIGHLIVLPPTRSLAALPVEALLAALPEGSPRPVVSYAPSASMFAHLTARRTPPTGAPRLMALGDPAFSSSGADPLALGLRDDLAPLPGSRREVQAIASLFPAGRAKTLLGPEATEARLQEMARSDELKGYRFLHLATHGKANPSLAMSSALFLPAGAERSASASADPAALESAPDGQITAEQIVRTWDLDADLVVLSACESGLGRYAGGEGYLGFAQALFVKGARSLVLSQWRVDDKATSLLMSRFYQNLLGQRPGLLKPMPKAEALHEAKQWLQNLTADEVGGELAALDRGPPRKLAKGSGGAAQGASPSANSGEVRPYAHPYYWAAFVLVGDPD
jgi:CHAT domain-containing protein/tetratricopeptide (TPR) repeat protein